MIVLLMSMSPNVRANGDEDHGEAQTSAPSTMPGTQGEMLTSAGSTDYFEVVAKYAATDAGDDTPMRLFIADFATNQPIRSAVLSTSFRPAGVVVRAAPKMVSPGIYDLVVQFPRDTVFALVATITAGQRTDFVEVSNIYSGAAADRFLAEHAVSAPADMNDASGGWIKPAALVAGILAVLIVAFIVVRRRRRRSADASISRDPELAMHPGPTATGDVSVEQQDLDHKREV